MCPQRTHVADNRVTTFGHFQAFDKHKRIKGIEGIEGIEGISVDSLS